MPGPTIRRSERRVWELHYRAPLPLSLGSSQLHGRRRYPLFLSLQNVTDRDLIPPRPTPRCRRAPATAEARASANPDLDRRPPRDTPDRRRRFVGGRWGGISRLSSKPP